MADVAQNLAMIVERIVRAGGDPRRVRVVAAIKRQAEGAVDDAVAAGILDIGENHAQDLANRAAAGPPQVRWHLLGPVQRNKVRKVAPYVHLWQAVDRLAAGQEIARAAPGAAVLVEVNTSGEPQKHGCTMDDAAPLVGALRDLGLAVRGLMTVGPLGPPEAARPAFRALAQLGQKLSLDELSMGMSADLEVAVQEGATIVRIGTALFGPRPTPAQARR